jgi:hypothetical protein
MVHSEIAGDFQLRRSLMEEGFSSLWSISPNTAVLRCGQSPLLNENSSHFSNSSRDFKLFQNDAENFAVLEEVKVQMKERISRMLVLELLIILKKLRDQKELHFKLMGRLQSPSKLFKMLLRTLRISKNKFRVLID